MIPAYHDAVYDPTVRGHPITVYLHLLNELDPATWRELKQLSLTTLLGISERSLRNALNTLVREGYLEREEYTHNQPRRYRLVYKRMP